MNLKQSKKISVKWEENISNVYNWQKTVKKNI